MRWWLTAALVAIAALALVLVLKFGETDIAEDPAARLAAGKFYPWTRDRVTAIEIAYPERSFALERREGEWWLTAPVVDRADPEDLTRMLAALEAQDVTRWLPPPAPGQLEETGLSAPRIEVRVKRGAKVDTMRFGDLNPVEQRLYVQASWRDSLALVSTLLRTHFMKGRFELADKNPLSGVPRDRVVGVGVENARGAFELARIDEGWEIRRPEAYLADHQAVERFLDRFWDSTIIDFMDQTPERLAVMGFERPSAVLTLRLEDESRPRILEIGGSYHRLRYARQLDRDPAFLLDSLTTTPLLESFSAFLSPVLIAFSPRDVTRLEDGEGRVLLRAQGEDWAWTDADGRPADAKGVSSLLIRILRLSTERVAGLLPRADQLREWGLSPPARTIAFRAGEGGKRHALELGAPVGGRIHFRRGDYPTVFSLPVERVDLPWPGPADSTAAGAP